VDEVSPGGITLNEFPGRVFQFSSVSTSAADMSARILGENNTLTRSEVAAEVDRRREGLREYLNNAFADGEARLVIPKGAAQSAEQIRAVILANGENVNQVSSSLRTPKPSRAPDRSRSLIDVSLLPRLLVLFNEVRPAVVSSSCFFCLTVSTLLMKRPRLSIMGVGLFPDL
jgi:hypothetical protein